MILSLYNKDNDAQKRRALQGKDKDIRGEFNYLGEAGGFKVYQPLDYISSMDLGVNTGWCTTGRYGHAGHPEFTPSDNDAKKHFNSYTGRGINFYYFLNPQTMYGEYAVALYPKTLTVNKVVGGIFIGKTNFEIYNAADHLDYSVAEKLSNILKNFSVDLVLEEASDLKENVVAAVNKKGVVVKSDEYKLAKSIIIPEGAVSIGKKAFFACESLTSVKIPNSVIKIDDNAFHNCISLTSITIPNSVVSISELSFCGCTSLTSITVPSSVTSIGYQAFMACTNLTSVTIQNGVTDIGRGAFEYCEALTSISIPDSVTHIGWAAFFGCTSLTSISIPMKFKDEAILKNIFVDNYNEDKINFTESLNEDKNETLNKDIWDDNNELRPEVKEKLELIVNKFKDALKEDNVDLDIQDVEIVGSNANYNYTDKSDIDLHIIADLSIYKDKEDLAEIIYNAYRRIFNDKFDPMIRGHEVELYVEPAEDTNSNDIPDGVEDADD